MEITYLEHPVIKEILEQQRMMLEFHMRLLEFLAKAPMVYNGEQAAPLVTLQKEKG